jgi:hypothetical protein
MRLTVNIMFMALVCVALFGCSKEPERSAVAPAPQAASAAQVIVVQQPAQQSGMGDMLMGGAIGYMMGQSSARNSTPAPAPQVIERRTVIREVPRPAPVQQAAVPRPVVPPPAPAMPQPNKPSFASTTPYKMTQNTPTYKAPPAPVYRPAPTYRPSPSYRSR